MSHRLGDNYMHKKWLTPTAGHVAHMICHMKYRYELILILTSITSTGDASIGNIDILVSVLPITNSSTLHLGLIILLGIAIVHEGISLPTTKPEQKLAMKRTNAFWQQRDMHYNELVPLTEILPG